MNAKGRGIGSVRIVLTDSQGTSRVAVTNPFGFYKFTQITAGQSVVISVNSKKFDFANLTQTVFVLNDLDEINFTANNLKIFKGDLW